MAQLVQLVFDEFIVKRTIGSRGSHGGIPVIRVTFGGELSPRKYD